MTLIIKISGVAICLFHIVFGIDALQYFHMFWISLFGLFKREREREKQKKLSINYPSAKNWMISHNIAPVLTALKQLFTKLMIPAYLNT